MATSAVSENVGTQRVERCKYSDFLDEMGSTFAKRGSVGVLYVDLSRLRSVERIYGVNAHEMAMEKVESAVLQIVSPYLKKLDLIARGESDADCLLVFFFRPRAEHDFYRHDLPPLAERLSHHLLKKGKKLVYPYEQEAASFPVGYGLSIFNPSVRDGRGLRGAIEQAQREARLSAEATSLIAERELIHLVIAEDIRSIYEPIVDLRTFEIYGHEALARGPSGTEWEWPTRLFGVAQDANLLFELDVLCRRAAMRGAVGKRPDGQKLFVNCLPSAINDPSFNGDALRQTLESCGLQPEDLVLEISERETIENHAIFRQARDYFRSVGVKIALDDTGSGYASMAAAMDVAPDIIKVDLSLVRTIDIDQARQALVRALQELADKLGAEVVAEGIETEAELNTLRNMGIAYGQGFFFGKGGAIRPAIKLEI